MKSVQLLAYILILTNYLVAVFHPSTEIFRQVTNHQYSSFVILTICLSFLLVFYSKAIRNTSFIESSEEAPVNTDGLHYCEFCKFYVPLRASHCRSCNKCILRKDHHCPCVGTCIGMNNHLYFLLTMIFAVLFSLRSMSSLKSGMIDGMSLSEWLYMSLPCTGMWCFSLLVMLQPVLLIPMHAYLALSNVTTREFLKGKKLSYLKDWHHFQSPFSKGPLRNLAEFVTMHRRRPVYSVPSTEDSLEQWRMDNFICANDYYQCC